MTIDFEPEGEGKGRNARGMRRKGATKFGGETRVAAMFSRKPIQIDRDKLRTEVRKLGNEYDFYMLDDAIEPLPPAKLYKIAKK